MTRGPCTDLEHPEAERVAASLREAGYAAHVESFDSRGATEPWLAGYALASAVAALLVYPLPLLAIVVGIAVVVLHARDSDGRPLLARRSCTASNTVAIARHAPSPAMVVVAPLLDRVDRLRPEVRRSLTLCLQALMAGVPAGGAAAWIAEVEAALPAAVAWAGGAAAVVLAALALTLYRPPGDDGATRPSPASRLLLDLAPLIADGSVWLIATGAPDAGGDAVEALLEEHPKELAGCVWLNLAMTRADGAAAVSEEGSWRERRGDRWLLDAAEEAGAAVRAYRHSTSATPLLARRRRALTLLIGGPDDLRTVVATVSAVTASSP